MYHERYSADRKKEGHRITNSMIKDLIDKTRKMNPYKTSMLLDYENNKPMEVEAIIGEPVRIAEKLKKSAPYLEAVYTILKFIDQH